jgi:hypothetical protein
MWIGHLGIGWLGTRQVPLGNAVLAPAAVAAPGMDLINTPIVGVRYWLSPIIGIDGGLGFYSTSGSQTASAAGVSVSTDKVSQTTFVLHGGVPIALGLEGKHFSFQITPEFDIGSGPARPRRLRAQQ